VMSSTIPSAKYSCSGSSLMFWNGNTAMDGLSGSASGGADWLRDMSALRGQWKKRNGGSRHRRCVRGVASSHSTPQACWTRRPGAHLSHVRVQVRLQKLGV
jgi:hypothetical protein